MNEKDRILDDLGENNSAVRSLAFDGGWTREGMIVGIYMSEFSIIPVENPEYCAMERTHHSFRLKLV